MIIEQLIGQSLDRYKIVSLLNKGEAGAIFIAQDTKLQQDVAVKVISPPTNPPPSFQEQFLQAARAAAKVDHPGIVRVSDFGEHNTWLYIVMDLVPGNNLRQMLRDLRRTKKWLTLPEALQLVRQICLAVDYAHRQGRINLDLRPNNIILKPVADKVQQNNAPAYQAILTDLGLANLLKNRQKSSTTLAFMAPERVLGQTTDARSDIYALGILLYMLTVGELPYHVKSLDEAIRYHQQEKPAFQRPLGQDLPGPVEEIIFRALAREAFERFPEANMMAEALGNVLLAMPAPADISRDRVLILSPIGVARSIPLTDKTVTIGRDKDNTVVLDHADVSRRHARLEFDGTQYRIIDLNSTNGTFLGNDELSPDIPKVWLPRNPLHIGEFQLHLERGEQPVASPATAIARASAAHTTPEVEPVGVLIETNHVSVTPGSNGNISIIIHNQGKAADQFKLSIRGIPADWVLTPPPVKLAPGNKQDVKLTIQTPRLPQSRTGRYPMTIRVTGRNNPDQFTEVEGTLTVASYSQFSGDIRPQRLGAGQSAQLVMQNQGNAPETFRIQWRDPKDELRFEPAQLTLNVSAGQTVSAEFRVSPLQRRLIGGQKTHPFSTRISAGTGEVQLLENEVIDRGSIPVWLLLLITVPILALCIILGVFIFNPSANPQAPTVQSVTIDPLNPIAGQAVTVRWRVDGADRIDFRPVAVSGLNPTQGEYTFSQGFMATTQLILVASNSFGSVEHPLTVDIIEATPTYTPEPNAPLLEDWYVFPAEITQGQPVTIRWRVNNAENVTLQPFGTVKLAGQIEDRPQQTKTYTLIATNQGKTVQRSQEVVVVAPPPAAPRIKLFTAEPNILVLGEVNTVRFSWETEQAETVTIEPSVGVVSLVGFYDLPAPSVDTTYTLTAKNAGGEIRIQLQVRVVTPTPTQTPTPTLTATFTPTPSATFTPTASATFTPTPSATFTPTPTASITPTPTATETSTPTVVPVVTDTPTPPP